MNFSANATEQEAPGADDGASPASQLPSRASVSTVRSTAELVPHSRLPGPTPWVVGIMVALTVIAAAAGLALSHIAAAARSDLAGGLTVQILDANPATRAQEARASLAVLGREAGVRDVRLVPDSEVEALLSPWLGAGATGAVTSGNAQAEAGDAVPVPVLIDAHLDGAITPARLDILRRALLRIVPSARVDAQAGWLKPVFAVIASLRWLALALIALLAAAMAAAVLLAARTALGQHRATIEVVHLLGGTDSQIARIFQRTIGIDAVIGGVAGFAAAALVVVALGERFADLDAGLVAGGALGLADWAVLGAIPLAAIALAMLTARFSVLSALRKTL